LASEFERANAERKAQEREQERERAQHTRLLIEGVLEDIEIEKAVQEREEELAAEVFRRAKRSQAGRRPSYDWRGLVPVLQKHVTEHGYFESNIDLANWACDNVKLVAGARKPKGANTEPDLGTVKPAIEKYGLDKIGLKPPAN
jgi:hypothetical protein